MNSGQRILLAWVAMGGIAIVAFMTQRRIGLVVAGSIFLGWGLVVASNYRGVAEAMPRRWGVGPFWQETSRGQLRLTFGFFAVFGLILVASGVHALG